MKAYYGKNQLDEYLCPSSYKKDSYSWEKNIPTLFRNEASVEEGARTTGSKCMYKIFEIDLKENTQLVKIPNKAGWWKCYKDGKLFGYFEMINIANKIFIEHFSSFPRTPIKDLCKNKIYVFYDTEWVKVDDN